MKILSIFAAFFALTTQAATVSYTVQTTQVQKLRTQFSKLSIKAMFSEVEQQSLKRLRREAMAQTQIIGPVNEADASAFEEKFAHFFPSLKLEKNSEVEFKAVEPTPNDPLYFEQWALKNNAREVRVDLDDLRTLPLKVMAGEDVRLPSQQKLKNLKEIKVAVLDTGVDITHPDLREIIRWKKDECEALTEFLSCTVNDKKTEKECIAKVGDIDRDKNGYPMDCAGWSVVSALSTDDKSPLSRVLGTPDMDDVLGHGTHVSGIIAAQQNNQIGISGIAPNVRIVPVRVIETPPTSPLRPQSLQTEPTPQSDDPVPAPFEDTLKFGKSSVELIARGMLYAITEKVQVMNLSLGWPATINSSVISDMVKLAQEQGIAVVAAAGNDSTDALVLPCSYPGVICVGSYGPDGKRGSYSNRGPGVDFLAPGTSILSTYPLSLRARFFTDLQGYEFMTGTSMAAPMASGALAILLGNGYSLNESLARILAGARYDDLRIGENLRLDLAKSFDVSPRPYVRAVERAPIRISWNQKGEKLKGSFHLKNLWQGITNCSIRYQLPSQKNVVTSTAIQNCGEWKSNEDKTFSFPIEILNPRASRDFVLHAELTYSSGPGVQYSQLVPIAVQVVPTPDLLTEVLAYETTAITGLQAGKGTMVRTLVAADAKSTFAKPEYIVMSRMNDDIGFQILSAEGSSSYQYSAVQKLTDLSWNFLAGQRFYSHEAKATRIALILRKTSEISGFTQMRFQIFDSKLEKLIRTIDYDGSFAPLPENFRWTQIDDKDAMIFLSNGKEPASKDVWHTILDLNVQLRCYVLNAEGKLSEIKVDENDKEIRIVDFVPYHAEDTELGETALLVIKGKDYFLNYFIGHYKNGVIANLQPFEIKPYRNLGFLKSSSLLTKEGPATGNVMSSSVGRGKMRSTVLLRSEYNTIQNGDFRFAPIMDTEGVNRVVGGFQFENKNSFFLQTNWDLQFHEFSNDVETVVKTSMNRFSFLPSFVSNRAFFPIVVKNELNQTEPALLTADIGSGFFNLSTLIPERSASGKVLGLLRPALLSFEGNETGCSFIGNPVWDAARGLYRMNSFCGTSVRSILLQLPSAL